MSTPTVTVFMAAHNRRALIGEAIESVLAQTFGDFELLVIDDGSSDGTSDVVDTYRDPRIRLVRHDRNQGTPRTRNHGLDLARGRYLAILDSDDVAYRRRLERQVRFLERNPSVAAVGSWAVGTDRRGRTRRLLVRVVAPRDIRARIPFVSCFKNPTMTGRTEVLRAYRYREEFAVCQDIDLWARISARHPLANLPAFLVRYRGGGSSHTDAERTRRMRIRVIRDCVEELGVAYEDADLERHEQLRNLRHVEPYRELLERLRDWLERLVEANRGAARYPEPEFTEAAAERWTLLSLAALRGGQAPPPLGRRSPLRDHRLDFLRTYARLAVPWGRGRGESEAVYADDGRALVAAASGSRQERHRT